MLLFQDSLYCAYNGEEGLKLFDEIKPDIVVLDVFMPDIDGIQVAKIMKHKHPDIPIIMNTAYDYQDVFGDMASEAWLVKSSDLEELKATIRKALKKR